MQKNMFPAIKASLSRARIASNIVTVFRDGPASILGVGLLSLYHLMDTSRISCIVEQTNRSAPLEDIILLNIDDLVLDSGLHGPVWDIDVKFISKYVDTHSGLYFSVE